MNNVTKKVNNDIIRMMNIPVQSKGKVTPKDRFDLYYYEWKPIFEQEFNQKIGPSKPLIVYFAKRDISFGDIALKQEEVYQKLTIPAAVIINSLHSFMKKKNTMPKYEGMKKDNRVSYPYLDIMDFHDHIREVIIPQWAKRQYGIKGDK